VVTGTYEHFIYADDEHVIRAVRDRATEAGFLTSEPASRGDYWSLLVYGSLDGREGEREQIKAICEAHGATYDGGGTYLGPLSALTGDE
jgi:hypothetical protein